MITRILLATFCVLISFNYTFTEVEKSQKKKADPPEAKCKLILKVQPTGEMTVHIKNISKTSVTLVMPGDGSSHHWRTPMIAWSALPFESKEQHPQQAKKSKIRRCGNISALKPKEVFVLKPNELKLIQKTKDVCVARGKSGKIRFVYYYTNDPKLSWSGFPLGKHDEKTMRRVCSSTPAILVSNEVVHIVKSSKERFEELWLNHREKYLKKLKR